MNLLHFDKSQVVRKYDENELDVSTILYKFNSERARIKVVH